MRDIFKNWRGFLCESLAIQGIESQRNFSRLVAECYVASDDQRDLEVLSRGYEAFIDSNYKLFGQILGGGKVKKIIFNYGNEDMTDEEIEKEGYPSRVEMGLVADKIKKVFPTAKGLKIEIGHGVEYEEFGYSSAESLADRIEQEGVIYVDTRFSNNENLDILENTIFRTVHDYYTHVIRGRKMPETGLEPSYGFNLKGELQAYNTHAKLVPQEALPALFCEVVAQVAHLDTFKDFPDPQKTTVLYGFDYINIGKVRCSESGPPLASGIGTLRDNFPLIMEEESLADYFTRVYSGDETRRDICLSSLQEFCDESVQEPEEEEEMYF